LKLLRGTENIDHTVLQLDQEVQIATRHLKILLQQQSCVTLELTTVTSVDDDTLLTFQRCLDTCTCIWWSR